MIVTPFGLESAMAASKAPNHLEHLQFMMHAPLMDHGILLPTFPTPEVPASKIEQVSPGDLYWRTVQRLAAGVAISQETVLAVIETAGVSIDDLQADIAKVKEINARYSTQHAEPEEHSDDKIPVETGTGYLG